MQCEALLIAAVAAIYAQWAPQGPRYCLGGITAAAGAAALQGLKVIQPQVRCIAAAATLQRYTGLMQHS